MLREGLIDVDGVIDEFSDRTVSVGVTMFVGEIRPDEVTVIVVEGVGL